jgi:precorrin-6B methylase 2
MDKTPHLAVENKKEDATGQQEQQPLRGTEAEIYERDLVPAIFAPWATILIEQAALQPDDRVLDVACGTGVVARLAARQVGSTGQIIGLDYT